MLLCTEAISVECENREIAKEFLLSLMGIDIERQNIYLVNERGEKLIPKLLFERID